MKGTASDKLDQTSPEVECLPFEAALRSLEQAVAALESGSLDLDDALATYENGIKMLERCQSLLDTAEKRVHQVLETQRDGRVLLEPFATDAEASAE
jgi:exodeoxyribonuclease VII small subunit